MDKIVLQPNPRLVRLSDVEQLTGFRKSHIYAAIKSGVFPAPIKSGRATRFLESEIFDWIRARVAADRDGSDPAPKLLVTETELAKALDISVSWLQKDRVGKKKIPFVKMGENVRYDLEEARLALKAMAAGGKRTGRA